MSYDFKRVLQERLKKMIDEQCRKIGEGGAGTWEDYQRGVGRVKALKEAFHLADDLLKEMQKEKLSD